MAKAAMKVAMKTAAMKAAMKATVTAKPAMKAMKAMKVKRTSIIASGKLARSVVWRGGKTKTQGGLTKETLAKSKTGKIVSKAASVRAKKAFGKSVLKKWCDACKQARKELKITGFCPVGGKTAQGEALYAKVKSILG